MPYRILPLNNNVLVEPLKPKETKEYTQKTLVDVETSKLNVLNYGRVIDAMHKHGLSIGDIVLYQKLASHNTNFGDPRQVLVPIEQIEGKLEEIADATNVDQAA